MTRVTQLASLLILLVVGSRCSQVAYECIFDAPWAHGLSWGFPQEDAVTGHLALNLDSKTTLRVSGNLRGPNGQYSLSLSRYYVGNNTSELSLGSLEVGQIPRPCSATFSLGGADVDISHGWLVLRSVESSENLIDAHCRITRPSTRSAMARAIATREACSPPAGLSCQNGGTWSCAGAGGQCSCTDGWYGIDCELCTVNSTCSSGGATCIQTFQMVSDVRTFECVPLDSIIVDSFGGKFTYSCDKNAQTCSLDAWVAPTGPPRFAHCDFAGCTVEQGNDGNTTFSCDTSKCVCEESGGCVDPIKTLMESVATTSKLVCSSSSGLCDFTQNELPITIGLQCGRSTCGIEPPPPPKKLTSGQIIGISLGSLAGLFLLIGLFVWFVLRRFLTKPRVLDGLDSTAIPYRAQTVTLSFEDVSFSVIRPDGTERVILHASSGYARSGEVTALMGASGCGKTTLLDTLAGRVTGPGLRGGTMKLNGVIVEREQFRQQCGYVIQDDMLVPTQTVRETLMFTAELRLPTTMSREEKARRVQRVMHDLALEDVADRKIGSIATRGISGGERRRVSIANVMITQPDVLLLDEPTSGLDSTSAQRVMACLTRLARENNTLVMCSIHQPRSSIFRAVDNLFLMKRGRIIYFGRAKDAANVFHRIGGLQVPHDFNPADFFLDVLADSSLDSHVRKLLRHREQTRIICTSDLNSYRQRTLDEEESVMQSPAWSPYADPTNASPPQRRPSGRRLGVNPGGTPTTPTPTVTTADSSRQATASMRRRVRVEKAKFTVGFWRQFLVLVSRFTLKLLRDPMLMRGHIAVAIAVGLFIGAIYWNIGDGLQGIQDRAGIFFFSLALFTFGSLSSLDVFISERPLFIHENTNGSYRASPYMLARTFVDFLPLRIIPPIIFAAICYWMVGLRMDTAWNFLLFVITLVVETMASAALCMAIGAIFPSTGVATLASVLALLFHMLFGGFLVSRSTMPKWISWLTYVSLFSYAFETLMVNEFNGASVHISVAGVADVSVSGNIVLSEFGLRPKWKSADVLILLGWTVVYLIVAYVALRIRTETLGYSCRCPPAVYRCTHPRRRRHHHPDTAEPMGATDDEEGGTSSVTLDVESGDEHQPPAQELATMTPGKHDEVYSPSAPPSSQYSPSAGTPPGSTEYRATAHSEDEP